MSIYYLLLLISIFTAAAAQFCFKRGVLVLGELEFSVVKMFGLIPRILQNGWLAGGLVLFGASFLVWLFALSKFPLNIAYPIVVAVQIVILAIVGMLFLKEALSLWQMLGIVLIIIGIFLLLSKGIV